MADRSIVVRLRAEVSEFVRGMQQAKKATEEVGGSAPKAESALKRMERSATENRAAWDSAGRTMLVAGGAVAALGAAALKTGIEYNTLQQTSRAALTTLLGGAEQANAQMDKLDAFARTSPFAKDVFIKAQQQMLGFGIEAQKVIPYLDSIQNAVAATGGSNQDIAELTRIFSQVQAAAKITAVDLMQFGQRGIDAATLIGSQMGMTGAQIRSEITKGSLDAGVALDALAAGMEQRFGGAADNVKDTFAGSMDRVKAAWRDLSSDLASGLVDPQGGGALVDWLNSIADAMRQFQGAPDAVKSTAGAFVGLATAASLLGGAFFTMTPRLVAAKAVFADAGWTMGRFARSIGVATAAIGVLAVAYGMWASAQAEAKARVEEFQSTLDEFGKRTDATLSRINDVLSSDRSNWIENLLGKDPQSAIDKAVKFGLAVEDLQGYILGQADATDRVNAAMREYIGNDIGSEARQRREETEQFVGILEKEAGALTAAEKAAAQKALADEAAGIAADEHGDSLATLTALTEEQIAASEAAAEAHAKWAGMVVESASSFVDLTGAYQGVIDKNKEMAQASADATKSTKDSWEDFYDGVSVSASDWIASLSEQVAAQESWAAQMGDLSFRVNRTMTGNMRDAANAMIDELLQLGPEGAAAVEDLNRMSDAELSEVVRLYGRKGDAMGSTLVNRLDAHRPTINVVDNASSVIDGITTKILRMPLNRTVTINTLNNEVNVRSGAGNMVARAGGGSVFGPGTATSDSIPALLSNGEHVLSAREVIGLGGHGEVERLRALARKGAQAFATGGAVHSRPMPAYASGGAVRGPAVNFPDTVRLDRESVREVVEGFLAGAHEVSTGVLAGAARDAGGRSSTKGLSW